MTVKARVDLDRARTLHTAAGTPAGSAASVPAMWLRYRRRAVAIDAALIVLATVLAFCSRLDPGPGVGQPDRIVLVIVVPLLWMTMLTFFRTYESRFLGVGSEEFQRVLRAAMCAGAAIGTLSWAFKLEIARGFVIIALPVATLLTLAARYVQRSWLHHQRRRGSHTQNVLLAGHRAGVEAMVATMSRASSHGMKVVGLCLPGGQADGATLAGVPVLGSLEEVAAVALAGDIDAVTVLPSPELDGPALRRLGWALEDSHAELYVAPSITEVVGPRVAIRPVVGMSLLHVERPELSGVRRAAKDAMDRVLAALGLLGLSPLLLAVAVAIKADSRGPVFFRQARVGKDGREFTMVKFRSMVTDAEHRLIDLRDSHDGNAVLFKMKDDPRVTRVGRVLRRTSMDELPQLVNVLRGAMSLVGPRPPLASEVDMYGADARRRLLVKPGLTGLWQISGRSDLDWDESVRLDLRYVENWSFTLDFMIMAKTLSAVVHSRGAY